MPDLATSEFSAIDESVERAFPRTSLPQEDLHASIVGGFGSGKGRWLWGQYSPMIPKRDFEELLQKARNEGTLLD